MILESVTEIPVYFYKISIVVINSILQHNVEHPCCFVNDKTVCPNQHIWMVLNLLHLSIFVQYR